MPPSSASAPTSVRSEELCAAVAEMLHQWCGIIVPPYRYPLIEGEVARLAAAGLGPADVVRLAEEDAAWREQLARTVSVPETYFFRHEGHFEVLRDIAERRAKAGVACRVLSAGCSTGEEVWSAAAVLAAAGLGRAGRASAVGWDLVAEHLTTALRGRYRAWSVRRGLHGYDGCVRPEGDEWVVASALRPLVSFRRVNLVRDVVPASSRFDVIFFRNVAIYWDRATVERVAASLIALLEPDGLLLVGPSDPLPVECCGLRQHIVFGARTYSSVGPRPASAPAAAASSLDDRRLRRTEALADVPRPVERRQATNLVRMASRARSNGRPASPPAPGVVDPPTESVQTAEESVVDAVRRLADQGRYDEAIDRLEGADDGSPAEVELWRGIVLLAMHRPGEAAEALRRTVFLEPEDAGRRRWLAAALEQSGRHEASLREVRNAEELER